MRTAASVRRRRRAGETPRLPDRVRYAMGDRIANNEKVAEELKDIRNHWADWRFEWEHKLQTNEIQFLRSVADFASTAPADDIAPSAQGDQSVRLIRFGRSASVTPGGPQPQGQFNPAAFAAPVVAAATAPIVTTTAAPSAGAVAAPDGSIVTTTNTTTPAGATPVVPALPVAET